MMKRNANGQLKKVKHVVPTPSLLAAWNKHVLRVFRKGGKRAS
jgi:hypothetical protein